MTEPSPTDSPTSARVLIRTRSGRVLGFFSWCYAVVVLGLLGMIRWLGGGWWGVVVLQFTPRWLFLAPLGLLAIFCGFRRNFGPWIVQSATAVVVLGPLMGLNLPVDRIFRTDPQGERIRIASYNLGMTPVSVEPLRAWLDARRIDIVCFQEGGREEDAVRKGLREAGWHLSRFQGIASRLPIISQMPLLPDVSDDDQRYTSMLERVRVKSRNGIELVVASVHLPTIRPGFELLMSSGQFSGIKRHQQWWRSELARVLSALAEVNDAPLILAGDFNRPADDTALVALQSNFRFAFDEAGWGYGYTRPSNYPWVRIDHILTGPDCGVVACEVGPDLGSDHLPIWAEVTLPK